MSNLNALKANFDATHRMLLQFIEICPDTIWAKTSGGFPVWQQVFHAFACYDFFIRDDKATPTALMYGEKEGDVVAFKERPTAPSKDEVIQAGEKAKKMVDDFIAKQSDASLSEKHAGVSARLGNEMSNAGMLGFLAAHNLYHLGCGDSALREEGLSGVL